MPPAIFLLLGYFLDTVSLISVGIFFPLPGPSQNQNPPTYASRVFVFCFSDMFLSAQAGLELWVLLPPPPE
jgi:hypothetical protein